MKTTLRKHYTRIPLLLGFLINILFIVGTFYFLTKNMYVNFSFIELLNFNLFSYTVIDGMNEKMAFALMVCFYAYTLSSIILSFIALIKKEPMFLTFLCILNFFFGIYKVVIDYLTMSSFTGNTQMIFLFVLISDAAFLLINALFETTLRKHHRPKILLVLDILSFLPVFVPVILSWYQTNISTSMEPIIVLDQYSVNLLCSLVWLSLPNLFVLYCAQFSASAGFKEESSERKFTEAKELTIPANNKQIPMEELNLQRKTGEIPVIKKEDISSNLIHSKSKIIGTKIPEYKDDD
ncbi:MAG: hypothetical protein ACI4U5_03845 [Bacilli bacterium]